MKKISLNKVVAIICVVVFLSILAPWLLGMMVATGYCWFKLKKVDSFTIYLSRKGDDWDE